MKEKEEERADGGGRYNCTIFPRPANSFQGSRTLSTGPNSKVIAPIPVSTRNPRDALREIEMTDYISNCRLKCKFLFHTYI